MRAVVLDKRFGVAVILKEDGSFCRKVTSAKEGQEIEIREKPPLQSRVLKPVFACLMTVLVSVVSWNYMVVEAYAYVTVDAESPLEISINRLDHVTRVEAIGEDGEDIALLLEQEIIGKHVDEAMDNTRVFLEKKNLLTEGENYIMIDVVSDSSEAREKLKDEVEKTFTAENDHIVVSSFDMNYRNEAHEHRLSPGRYSRMEETKDEEGRAKEEKEYRNASIEELFKQNEPDHDKSEKPKAEESEAKDKIFGTDDIDANPEDTETE